jgi:hypothetical protein
VGVFYYLDGVRVPDVAAYTTGFNAATTRFFTITTSPLAPSSLNIYSHQNPGYNSAGALYPNTLGKFGGVFFSPAQQPSTISIVVEPTYVPTEPVLVTVRLTTFTDQVEEITFTILPP